MERYRLYVDESGDHVFRDPESLAEPSYRFLALIGCMMKRGNDYEEFSHRLDALKRKHFKGDLDDLHETIVHMVKADRPSTRPHNQSPWEEGAILRKWPSCVENTTAARMTPHPPIKRVRGAPIFSANPVAISSWPNGRRPSKDMV